MKYLYLILGIILGFILIFYLAFFKKSSNTQNNIVKLDDCELFKKSNLEYCRLYVITNDCVTWVNDNSSKMEVCLDD